MLASLPGRVVDISQAMTAPLLPAVFKHLKDTHNLAADAALVEALPRLEPFAQAAAIEILVQRANPPFLAEVVGRFNDYTDALQRLILAHVSGLSAGVRIALSTATFQHRAGAIETIVRGEAGRLAYLLADALRSQCRRTRELAATGLNRMTGHLLDRLEAAPPAAQLVELNALASYLAETLGIAVRRWESHLQPAVLQAALWLGGRVEPEILGKLRERRTKIAHALIDLLQGSSDTRLAGFILRALAVPELRSAAAQSISRASNRAFLRALLTESWLLADAEIERGCRRLRDGRWVQDAVDELLDLEGPVVACAVRFLASIGGQPDRRIKLLGELLGAGHDDVRRAVVWQLVCDESNAATDLLTAVAARPGDVGTRIAARELRRRRGGVASEATTAESTTTTTAELAVQHAFDRYWNGFDDLSLNERARASDVIRSRVPQVDILLRAKMASADPLNRARALRVAKNLGLVKDLEESIYRSTSAPEPIVRSLAVSMLADLPGPTTERLLRTAVNDPDERVQANAIEVLDQLNTAGRINLTRKKLESSNSRVRANAVKSLLRVELRQAGAALLDMLDAPSAAHRLSALWVIERVGLPAMLTLVNEMSSSDPDKRVRMRAKRVFSLLAPKNKAFSHSLNTPAQVHQVHHTEGRT